MRSIASDWTSTTEDSRFSPRSMIWRLPNGPSSKMCWVFELWFWMLKAVIWSEILKCSTMLPWSTITIARKESAQTLTDTNTLKHKNKDKHKDLKDVSCTHAKTLWRIVKTSFDKQNLGQSQCHRSVFSMDADVGTSLRGDPRAPQQPSVNLSLLKIWLTGRSDGCGTVLKSRWCNQTMCKLLQHCFEDFQLTMSLYLRTSSASGHEDAVFPIPIRVIASFRGSSKLLVHDSQGFRSKLQQWYTAVPCICGHFQRFDRIWAGSQRIKR